MPQFLIVDMHTLWLIGGVVTLATAGVVAFLRSLHHSSANALGLQALALAVGGAGLLLAAFAPIRPDSLLAAIADATIASALLLACEAVRRLYGANPRPALLVAFLFAAIAGCLGFEAMREEPAARVVFTSVLVAMASSLTAIRIARTRDPPAEAVRRLLVAAGFVNALVWLLRSGLAADSLGLPVSRTEMAQPLDIVTAALVILLPAIVTALMVTATYARMADELRALATTDPLTRLVSRRVLFERGRPLIAAMRAAERPLAAMMVDIDHFKRINDRYGHPAGDAVLRHCARQLRAGTRADSLVARYGGEEFGLLVPLDRPSDGFVAAERLRHRVSSRPCQVGDASIAVTVSIGMALLQPGQTLEQLLAEADRLLYTAKRGGRDRVGTAEAPGGQADLALPVV